MQFFAKSSRSWSLFLALALTIGCKAKEQQSQDSREETEDNGDSGAGSPAVGMMGALLSNQLSNPGPYDPPVKSEDFDSAKDHLVSLEISGAFVDLATFAVWKSPVGIELRKFEESLAKLTNEDHVKSLVLRADSLTMSMSLAEELRNALLRFKATGRKLWCYGETLSTTSIYVFSACDQIGIAPVGGVEVSGVSAVPIHIHDLLSKFNVKAQFIHIGDFKGAAEPLTLSKPSPAMQKTLGAVLDTWFGSLVSAIQNGRGLEKSQVLALIDKGVFQPEQALAAKLVDSVTTFSSFRDQVRGELPWTEGKIGSDIKDSLGQLNTLLGLTPPKRSSAPHIALVYAVGSVVDGPGRGTIGARDEIASRPLASALRILGDDEAVKAIVLRVNSPGGSALASEMIWREVDAAVKKKPVIVSMSTYAASGGYYISSGATKIFALGNTLTGSIGVVGGKLAYGDALSKFGVNSYPITRGKRAAMWSPLVTWSKDDLEVIRDIMGGVYTIFTKRVSEGRKISPEKVEEIAQGRVWTGVTAETIKLVDEIGGLHDAIAHARTLTDLPEAELEVYPPAPTLPDILKSFGGIRAPQITIPLFENPSAIQALGNNLFTWIGTFEKTNIQTRSLLPLFFDL